MNILRFITTIYESMVSSREGEEGGRAPLIQEHPLFSAQRAEPLQRLLKGDKIPLERATRGWAKLQLIN